MGETLNAIVEVRHGDHWVDVAEISFGKDHDLMSSLYEQVENDDLNLVDASENGWPPEEDLGFVARYNHDHHDQARRRSDGRIFTRLIWQEFPDQDEGRRPYSPVAQATCAFVEALLGSRPQDVRILFYRL